MLSILHPSHPTLPMNPSLPSQPSHPRQPRESSDPSDPPGRLAGILANGCPSLEKYNGMDLRALGKNGSWLAELKNHKGQGVNKEDCEVQTCIQCFFLENIDT